MLPRYYERTGDDREYAIFRSIVIDVLEVALVEIRDIYSGAGKVDSMDETQLQSITNRQVRAVDYAHDKLISGAFQWPTLDMFELIKHDLPALVFKVRQLRKVLDAHGILPYRDFFDPDKVAWP